MTAEPRRCLMPVKDGADLKACGEPAVFACGYGLPHARHYRCAKHRPPRTHFATIRRLR